MARIILNTNEKLEIFHEEIDNIVNIESIIDENQGLRINVFKWEYKNEYKYLDHLGPGVHEVPDLSFEEMHQKKIIHTEYYPINQEVEV